MANPKKHQPPPPSTKQYQELHALPYHLAETGEAVLQPEAVHGTPKKTGSYRHMDIEPVRIALPPAPPEEEKPERVKVVKGQSPPPKHIGKTLSRYKSRHGYYSYKKNSGVLSKQEIRKEAQLVNTSTRDNPQFAIPRKAFKRLVREIEHHHVTHDPASYAIHAAARIGKKVELSDVVHECIPPLQWEPLALYYLQCATENAFYDLFRRASDIARFRTDVEVSPVTMRMADILAKGEERTLDDDVEMSNLLETPRTDKRGAGKSCNIARRTFRDIKQHIKDSIQERDAKWDAAPGCPGCQMGMIRPYGSIYLPKYPFNDRVTYARSKPRKDGTWPISDPFKEAGFNDPKWVSIDDEEDEDEDEWEDEEEDDEDDEGDGDEVEDEEDEEEDEEDEEEDYEAESDEDDEGDVEQGEDSNEEYEDE